MFHNPRLTKPLRNKTGDQVNILVFSDNLREGVAIAEYDYISERVTYQNGLTAPLEDFRLWMIWPREAKPTDDSRCMMCGWVGHHEAVVWAELAIAGKIYSDTEAPHCPDCDTAYNIAGIDGDLDQVPL